MYVGLARSCSSPTSTTTYLPTYLHARHASCQRLLAPYIGRGRGNRKTGIYSVDRPWPTPQSEASGQARVEILERCTGYVPEVLRKENVYTLAADTVAAIMYNCYNYYVSTKYVSIIRKVQRSREEEEKNSLGTAKVFVCVFLRYTKIVSDFQPVSSLSSPPLRHLPYSDW